MSGIDRSRSKLALHRLGAWRRQHLASAASILTRMVGAANLTRLLGPDAPQVYVKMDSETGLALGGNKVRKLEFELSPDRLAGVTHLITTGGPQSNHCRITAAAAAHLGLGCVLVINGRTEGEPKGNAFLQRLFGAEIVTVAGRAERAPAMEEAARRIAGTGGRALIIPLGASTPLGSLGYAIAAVELEVQLRDVPSAERTWVFVSASSCGTLAGLLLGFSLLDRADVRLVGVSADTPAAEMHTEAVRLATEAGALLEWNGAVRSDLLSCDDTQVGPGYGIPTEATWEAIHLFGRTQGIVLDPVYTGKAAAGMLDWIRSGRVPPTDRVVFVHTGGHPALLA